MFRRTHVIAAMTGAALALTLVACAKPASRPAPKSPEAVASYPVTAGSATLAKRPTRVVSLSPTTTEMLFTIGAGPQVVAVDDRSNYPPGAPRTDLSGFNPNAEAIAGKSPDLVVLSNDTNKIVDQLGRLKIPVYLAPAAKTLDDTYTEITDLGKLTGQVARAATTVAGMKRDIAGLRAKLPARDQPLRYYWELDPTYYSATSKTFIGSLLGLAGLDSIATGSTDYPQLSAEAVVKANPDLIFLADTNCCKQSLATVKARPGWSEIAAVRNDRVYPLDDDVASRWGPRAVDLLRTVTDAVAKVPA